ncbi:MAG: BON domain-containing protein [Betaproteobacteria bacterium]|jgi:osmotically-inducible protein OsmY|nr:BON domain-containing protein [Betaproteobacteria bacterium]
MMMMRTGCLALIAVSFAALLQGCVPVAAVGVGMGVSAVSDRRTPGTQIEDEGIELRTSNRISERWGSKVQVGVTGYNRSVLLTGEVSDAATRDAVGKLAAGVPNVKAVTNEIVVAGLSTLSARSNDSFITSKVKARFVEAGKFNPLHVKVVTEAGTVFLLGIVTQGEADAATEIARTTGGVRKVVRLFEYCKVTDEVCRPAEAAKGEPAKPAASSK